MSRGDAGFAGSIPELYDRLLVPLIFESYARDLAGRVAARDPRAVLETAVGTGVVTRILAPQIAPEATYFATDLNPPMLEIARTRQPQDPRMAWQQADALDLPFPDAAFDAVLCQFGVMFFPDRPAGYAQARRVLKPGGALHFNAWDRIEENAFLATVIDALATVFPDDPPRFMARTPHGYGDTDRIAADLRAAGFARFEIDTVTKTSRGDSPEAVALAFCQGTPTRNEIEDRDPAGLVRATEAVRAMLEDRFGTGPIEGPIRAHVVTACA